MKYVSSYFEVLTEKRPGYTRFCLCLSLFFAFAEFIAFDNQLMMLLMKRPPFGWSDKVWTVFTLVKNGCYGFGMIALPLFLTFVSWLGKDSLMIIVGVSSSAACFFVISLATNTSEIFMTAVLGVLTGAIFTGYKSFLPRMVRKDQTARLSTINSIVQSFCPILSALIFNNIFNSTLDYWPGMAFLLGGILQVIVVIGQM
ncbi:hypothetical protein WR25_09395 isoform A [Diploscapter pachys]|uniref:Major facilitator superfamily (MFS) profile domain-containing protein n=2 Tax=Diploscapter pachys TaxID=2018661 RepID=A0A2A2JUC2_9BILA|nr:hypothetical protein WR25_09395 isoform A [Diploscapter pachys]